MIKKILVIIFVLVLLGYLAHVWEKQYCKNLVKDMTGSEAIDKYEECKKW
jgi:hypothetical protein